MQLCEPGMRSPLLLLLRALGQVQQDFSCSILVSPGKMPVHRDTIPQHSLTSRGLLQRAEGMQWRDALGCVSTFDSK